jgi:hypothetical protein
MNRINHPLVVKVRKRPKKNQSKNSKEYYESDLKDEIEVKDIENEPNMNTVTTEPNMNTVTTEPNMNNINDYINLNKRSLENSFENNYLENLDEFKDQLEENISMIKQRLDSIENKSNNSNIEEINYALELIHNINSGLENYKKTTDDRINKIVKLFLIIDSKISGLKNNNENDKNQNENDKRNMNNDKRNMNNDKNQNENDKRNMNNHNI